MAGDKKTNVTGGRKKKRKFPYKKLIYLVMALILVGGLVLSASMGLVDYFARGNRVLPTEQDEQLAVLLQWVDQLEDNLKENPEDAGSKAELGGAYFELAMYCSEKNLEDYDEYAVKSKGFLQEAVEDGFLETWVTFRIALLALAQKDDAEAEEYFRVTFDLDENYAEPHLYYAAFLSARERAEEARFHWEKVIELESEDSFLAQTAQHYLNATE